MQRQLIAAGDGVYFALLAELIEHVLTAVILEPGILLARIQPERNRAIKRKGRVLADEVIGGGVTHLDRYIANCIDRLQCWNDLPAREGLDLKLVVGGFRDIFRNCFGCAEGHIQRLRPTCGAAPLQFRHRLRDGRRSNGGRHGEASAGCFQKLTTFHGFSPSDFAHLESPTRGHFGPAT